MPRAKLVPFSGRTLRKGMSGKDVLAVKRALAYIDGGPLKGLTQTYGSASVKRVRRFQEAQGITPATGNYGPRAHAKLAPHFDDYAIWLYTGFSNESYEMRARRKIVAAMTLLYNNAPEVHYTMSAKRMQGVREKIKPPEFPRYEDCSSSSTWAYWVAGASDPNGLGYNGLGYTGTLCQNGRVVSFDNAQPGDLVFYGRGAPWGHVAVYIGGGRILSHGSEPGPYLLPIDYRADRGEIRSYL